jgi:hypothetical protein
MLPSSKVGVPVTHGAGVAGTQGIGVSTPNAAAVAAATTGLAGDIHIPNGMMLTIGLLSIIFAAGILLVSVRFCGKTTSVPGAAPKLHFSVAPLQTCIGISDSDQRCDRYKLTLKTLRIGTAQGLIQWLRVIAAGVGPVPNVAVRTFARRRDPTDARVNSPVATLLSGPLRVMKPCPLQ